MKTSDILIGLGVAVGVVVAYKVLTQSTTPPAAPGQAVDPTLAGVAGIVGATSGLLESIGNLVRKPKTAPPEPESERRALLAPMPRLGRMDWGDTSLNLRGENAVPTSGYAIEA